METLCRMDVVGCCFDGKVFRFCGVWKCGQRQPSGRGHMKELLEGIRLTVESEKDHCIYVAR
jgi:hypothetical protein